MHEFVLWSRQCFYIGCRIIVLNSFFFEIFCRKSRNQQRNYTTTSWISFEISVLEAQVTPVKGGAPVATGLMPGYIKLSLAGGVTPDFSRNILTKLIHLWLVEVNDIFISTLALGSSKKLDEEYSRSVKMFICNF